MHVRQAAADIKELGHGTFVACNRAHSPINEYFLFQFGIDLWGYGDSVTTENDIVNDIVDDRDQLHGFPCSTLQIRKLFHEPGQQLHNNVGGAKITIQ